VNDSIWEALLGVEARITYVNAGGIRTRALVAGSGPPLIFLHGNMGHLETFYRNIRAHAEHFTVYAIDMVGHGFSAKPLDRDYLPPTYAEHVRDFCDAVGAQKVAISGESLGGWVAGWFAQAYPERTAALVLNTAGGLSAYPEVMDRIKRLNRAAIANPTTETVRTRLESLMFDKSVVSDELIAIRRAIYALPEMRDVLERILVLQDMDTRQKYMLTADQLAKVTAPTCVIWTTHDPTAPVSVGEKYQSLIRGAKMHVMENCGHWPQFEDTETFNRIHIGFLREALA
jgi:2-hydroxy-6-oxonona-2,4-dienedioate hydrolase